MSSGQARSIRGTGSGEGIRRAAALRWLGLLTAVVVAGAWGLGPAPGGAAESGRALYAEYCAHCHGSIDETQSGALDDVRLFPAVMTPLGPNLTGIFGRPAGTVPGYRYSNAFRKAAAGLVWNADSLDRWLADSQAMIRGSYMFLKLARPARSRVIRYLEAYSRYDGTSG